VILEFIGNTDMWASLGALPKFLDEDEQERYWALARTVGAMPTTDINDD
jgi:hypothetical protein